MYDTIFSASQKVNFSGKNDFGVITTNEGMYAIFLKQTL